jgi:prolyl-tRNA editing enzyme YbaK/EbsC (Cys-tRNA(Pro) deacylase)
MGFAEVKAYFAEKGMEDRILTFDVSSATVELAAAAIGCEPGKIAKSLTFMTKEGPIMIVAAGYVKIDNPKFKAQFGEKAKMLPPEETLALIGHPVGGVCPFAVKSGVKIYLDNSLKRYAQVFPACGSGNSAIGLSIAELEMLTEYPDWIDVSKEA